MEIFAAIIGVFTALIPRRKEVVHRYEAPCGHLSADQEKDQPPQLSGHSGNTMALLLPQKSQKGVRVRFTLPPARVPVVALKIELYLDGQLFHTTDSKTGLDFCVKTTMGLHQLAVKFIASLGPPQSYSFPILLDKAPSHFADFWAKGT
jgi:hypothetical protein